MVISWFASLKFTLLLFIIATLLPNYHIFISFVSSFIFEIGEWVNRPEKLLLIGVVSSQENLIMRNAIRETWKNLVDDHNTQLKFIIGKHTCNVPLADRLSKYDCLSWNPDMELSLDDSTEIHSLTVSSDLEEAYFGVSFRIKHEVVIRKLGIISDILHLNLNNTLRLSLTEAGSGFRLATVSFNYGNVMTGVIWKQIKSVGLSADFEGELRLDTNNLSLPENCRFQVNKRGNIIINEATIKGNKYFPYMEKSCPMVGLAYHIKYIEELSTLVADKEIRQLQWDKHTNKLKNSLIQEEAKFADILFLNITDVYRNLSNKVQHFFEWVNEKREWRFILKTDDDVFVDVRKVEKELKNWKGDWEWWSCFRVNWTVPRSGKWKDVSYSEDHYPRFPSGSGYVVTYKMLNKINGTVGSRGEDVNMGMLLRGAKEHLGNACHWACDYRCNENACNLPQLTQKRMFSTWEKYKSSHQSSIC